jgi:hypothetical protein
MLTDVSEELTTSIIDPDTYQTTHCYLPEELSIFKHIAAKMSDVTKLICAQGCQRA